jgi:amino acid transporter
MTLAVPRALYAFARDGFLPRVLGRVHPRFHTPHFAIATQSALVCLLAITSGFERLAILANLVTLLLYAGCCLAAWELGRREPSPGGISTARWRVTIVPFAACAAIGWLLTSITRREWQMTFLLLGTATLVFILTAGARAGRRAPAGTA